MTQFDERAQVILVDERDRPLGTAPKLDVHRDGRLHRAISVQLSDGRGRLLLQRRHIDKYHSGGLWTNTCCSHPHPGETPTDAAVRRLKEEMGIHCTLRPLFTTHYRADVGNGLVEHEIVHVFAGEYDGRVCPDPHEVDGFAYVTPEELAADLEEDAKRPSSRYSAWFKIYARDYWRLLAPS